MAVYQYQTVGLKIHVKNADAFDDIVEAVVSVRQGYNLTHFKLSDSTLEVDAENQTLECFFGQEETAQFDISSPLILQVNILNGNQERLVSKKVVLEDVEDNLYKVVM